MSQTVTRTLTVMALVALAAAPAGAADKEQQQMMADIRILQEQSQQLQNLIGSLGETLKAVNARIDQQTESNRKSFADQKVVVDTLSSDLRIVREKVDDNNVRISSLSQEVDALRQTVQDLNSRSMTAWTPPAVPGDPNAAVPPADGSPNSPGGLVPPPTPPAAVAPAPPPPVAVGSPTRLYDMAFSNYTSGLWDLAIDGFDSYIRSFPKSDMADDAQVLIGNSYLQDGKNDKAVEAYDRAIRTYQNGNAIPEAYFKKGLALKNLKQLDLAREAFDYAVKNFPDSAPGQLARQQLSQLTPAPAPR